MRALFTALAALALASSATLFLLTVRSRARRWTMRRRLQSVLGPDRGTWQEAPEGLAGLLIRLGNRRLGHRHEDPEITRLLLRAGYRRPRDQALVYGLQLALPPAAAAVTALLWLAAGLGLSLNGALAVFAALAAGYLAPKQLLRQLARRRQRQAREEVPVLAQVLKVLFDAGLSLDQSLLTVATEHGDIIPVLAGELKSAMRQVARGADRGEALEAMARALEVPELSDLITMLRQIDRYGGAIQQPLTAYLDLLDERRRTELQERVGKLSGGMTIVMVLFMFPALLVFLAGPGVVAILRTLAEVGN